MDINKYCIYENASLIEALKRLDETCGQPLFVLRNGRLAAALTDGDIRRYILKTGNTQAQVSDIANYNPEYISPGEEARALRWMKRKGIKAIPIVDGEMRILDVLFRDESPAKDGTRISLPVVINAGGKGTRLYPYTRILPKPLIPVGDMPIAEIIINRFADMGCNKFYMIVNHKKNMIKAYFNEVEGKNYSLTFLDEEKPLGTGGGLALLKGMLDETFIFINCDTVIEEDFGSILKTHRDNGNQVTMVSAVKRFDVPYGVVETGENGSIQAFREKPQFSYLVNAGCYIVEPEVIDELVPDEAVGFPTVIDRLRREGKQVGIHPVSQEAWLDMGQFDTMEDMRRRLSREKELETT